MAAHVLTALNQIIEDPEGNMQYLPSALDLSCWTEDLDLQDYCQLRDIVKMNHNESYIALQGWARLMRMKYTPKWERLGRPETREAWRKAKWG